MLVLLLRTMVAGIIACTGGGWKVALDLLHDHHDARDTAQDAFLAAWQGLAGFRGECGFGTWLHPIVTRLALNKASRRRYTVSLHDVGAAGWFGGSLMGAVALNGASKDVSDPAERSKIAASGWARWAPFAATAIGAHLLGGSGLLLAHRDRAGNQPGVGANTVVKTVLTLAALGTTAYSGLLGAKLGNVGDVKTEGGTVPGEETPDDVARTQRRLRILQWATPVLTGTLVVLGAQQANSSAPASGSAAGGKTQADPRRRPLCGTTPRTGSQARPRRPVRCRIRGCPSLTTQRAAGSILRTFTHRRPGIMRPRTR